MDTNGVNGRAAQYVLAGIDRLQKLPQQKGAAWYERLDSDALNQSSTTNDILGQLFGEYWKGLVALGFVTEDDRVKFEDSTLVYFPKGIVDAARCGFALGDEFMTWEALTAEWKRQIARLKSCS